MDGLRVDGVASPSPAEELLSQLPATAREIMTELALEPLEIWRNGPRYVAATTVGSHGHALFKLVLPNIHGADITARKTAREIEFLRFLKAQPGFEASAPAIFAASTEKPVWVLRSLYSGSTMAAGESTFRYAPAFYEEISPEEIVDYFVRLHAATDHLPRELKRSLGRYAADLGFYKQANHWPGTVLPQEEFIGLTTDAIALFDEAKEAFDNAPRVIAHSEPYGPHLFKHGESISLIDWENVALWHPLHDLSIIWIRAFENPVWQHRFYRAIEAAGYLEGDRMLVWRTEIVMQAATNYVYFKYHANEEHDFREAAKAFFLSAVKSTLY